MKKVNLNDRTTFYASDELIEELKSKMTEGDTVLNFAYTDYGGDFFDKMIIRYFEEKHPEGIVSESTAWYGRNAFIFGALAVEMSEAIDRYLLGFGDTEEFYYMMESEERTKGIEGFVSGVDTDKFTISDEIPDQFMEWVEGYCNILTSGLDYSESSMMEKAIETGYLTPIVNAE